MANIIERWLKAESDKEKERGSYMQKVYSQYKPQGDIKPTPEELVSAMLRDHRFKKIMLSNAEQMFWNIPPEVRLQLFRDAARDMLNSYKIRDVKELYNKIGKELKKERCDKDGKQVPATRE